MLALSPHATGTAPSYVLYGLLSESTNSQNEGNDGVTLGVVLAEFFLICTVFLEGPSGHGPRTQDGEEPH